MSQQKESSQRHELLVNSTNTLDFLDFYKILFEYKKIIIGLTLLLLFASYYYAKTQPTRYLSEVMLFPSSESSGNFAGMGGGVSKIAGFAGISIDAGKVNKRLGKAIEILKTRQFLLKFSKENNLKKIVFQNKWDKDKEIWREKEPSDEDLYQVMLHSIEIKTPPPRAISEKLSIVFELKDVDDYSEIANILTKLVSSINKLQKNDFIRVVNKKNEFLKKEIERNSVLSVQSILYRMIESNIQSISVASASDGFIFNIIDPAIIPIKPEPKKTLMILFIGMFLGLLTGITTSIIMSRFNKKI